MFSKSFSAYAIALILASSAAAGSSNQHPREGRYTIRSASEDDQVLSVEGKYAGPNRPVKLVPSNDRSSRHTHDQEWEIRKSKDGYNLLNTQSKMCLTAATRTEFAPIVLGQKKDCLQFQATKAEGGDRNRDRDGRRRRDRDDRNRDRDDDDDDDDDDDNNRRNGDGRRRRDRDGDRNRDRDDDDDDDDNDDDDNNRRRDRDDRNRDRDDDNNRRDRDRDDNNRRRRGGDDNRRDRDRDDDDSENTFVFTVKDEQHKNTKLALGISPVNFDPAVVALVEFKKGDEETQWILESSSDNDDDDNRRERLIDSVLYPVLNSAKFRFASYVYDMF